MVSLRGAEDEWPRGRERAESILGSLRSRGPSASFAGRRRRRRRPTGRLSLRPGPPEPSVPPLCTYLLSYAICQVSSVVSDSIVPCEFHPPSDSVMGAAKRPNYAWLLLWLVVLAPPNTVSFHGKRTEDGGLQSVSWRGRPTWSAPLASNSLNCHSKQTLSV